jgi:hypothetical protein
MRKVVENRSYLGPIMFFLVAKTALLGRIRIQEGVEQGAPS